MDNGRLVVRTPRGQIVESQNKGGKLTARLEWDPDFGRRKTELYTRAQKFVDNEVLRLSRPYIPIRTGALSKSGDLGTVPGEGQVTYNIPYAKAQYYNHGDSRAYDSQRGGHWFARMKIDRGKEIIRGAKQIAGGG